MFFFYISWGPSPFYYLDVYFKKERTIAPYIKTIKSIYIYADQTDSFHKCALKFFFKPLFQKPFNSIWFFQNYGCFLIKPIVSINAPLNSFSNHCFRNPSIQSYFFQNYGCFLIKPIVSINALLNFFSNHCFKNPSSQSYFFKTMAVFWSVLKCIILFSKKIEVVNRLSFWNLPCQQISSLRRSFLKISTIIRNFINNFESFN